MAIVHERNFMPHLVVGLDSIRGIAGQSPGMRRHSAPRRCSITAAIATTITVQFLGSPKPGADASKASKMAIVHERNLMPHLVVEVDCTRRNAKAFRSTSVFDYGSDCDDDCDRDCGPVSWKPSRRTKDTNTP